MIEEKDYKYILPGENNNPKATHRIGVQRALTFGNYIQQKSYEQATNLIIYGQENPTRKHNQHWEWDGEKYNYTSSLLNDYENLLSALVALQINQQEQFNKNGTDDEV